MNLLFFVCELYLIEVKTIARMIFHSHKEVSKSLPYRFYKSFQKYKLILTFDLHFCTFIETPDLLFIFFFFSIYERSHRQKACKLAFKIRAVSLSRKGNSRSSREPHHILIAMLINISRTSRQPVVCGINTYSTPHSVTNLLLYWTIHLTASF